jgi:hypothetical protein
MATELLESMGHTEDSAAEDASHFGLAVEDPTTITLKGNYRILCLVFLMSTTYAIFRCQRS